jgi:4-diphosphocytidyl-2-C-methyl-D-erythritol kinase
MYEDRPPAKVNLTLEVLGRRPDGYHDLRSIFLRVGLADRLTMAPSSGDRDRLTVTGLAGAPATRDNLALRALDALRAHAGIDFPPLDVTLDKQIPAAAGLGGGSSDAASALKLAQACWGIGLSTGEEMKLAAELGSDVPFFTIGAAAAIVEGRGEHVAPLIDVQDVGVLLVTPGIELSTARVFDRFDEIGEVREVFHSPAIDLDNLVLEVTRLTQDNHLWVAAASLEPSLHELRWDLEEATRRPWLLSGSGPTLFAIYPSVSEAAESGQALVASRLPSLDSALINAVDLVGPDPAWRYP